MSFLISDKHFVFPHPLLSDPDGFLCVSESLNPDLLLLAYRFGIFPWHNQAPVLWWFTHPRCVLFPSKVHISKSMRQLLKRGTFSHTMNQNFEGVIRACQQVKRKDQGDTWIKEELISAFTELHIQGFAHSVEVWQEGQLVGGLYGLAIGKIFYGESMFAHRSNASKYALIKLAQHLEELGFQLIDCQQETQHLISMGAELIDRFSFLESLRSNIFVPEKFLYNQLANHD